MPRHPKVVDHLSSMSRSAYSSLAHRLEAFDGETFPLHIGDTWMEPATGSRMQDLTVEDNPGMHRYAPVQGHPKLIEAIAAKTRAGSDHPAERKEILVTAGATGGLYGVASALFAPGDEVLILAPFWPLMRNAINCVGAQPVAVPFFETATDPTSAVETLQRHLSNRTVAVYWNTPHNPTGRLIPASWLEAMARWAEANDLWIIADEVYEDYTYGGEHVYSRPFAPERTIAAYSFSKAYGMAGNRCGYLTGPREAISAIGRITRNSYYSVNTAAQLAAINCLEGSGASWLLSARRQYEELGYFAADRLGVCRPEGSTFLFFDVSDHLDERGMQGFLEDCADQGLLVAPGSSFGPYPTHVRLCFTSAEPRRVRGGVEVMARMMGR